MRVRSLCVLVVLVCLPPLMAEETLVAGKSLDHWKARLRIAKAGPRIRAAEKLREAEPEQLVALMPEFRLCLRKANPHIRTRILELFTRKFTKEAEPALPELLAIVDRPPKAKWEYEPTLALRVICGIGPKAAAALPTLRRFLGDAEHPLSEQTLGQIGQLGSAARTALPEIEAVLTRKPKNYSHQRAAYSVLRIDPEHKDIARMVRLMVMAEHHRKCGSSPWVCEFGLLEKPRVVVRHTLALLEDEEPAVRQQAARVLAIAQSSLGTTENKALAEALEPVAKRVWAAFPDKEPAVAVQQAYTIAGLDKELGKATIPFLVKYVSESAVEKKPRPLFRGRFTATPDTLFGIYPKVAIPLLIEALAGKSPAEQDGLRRSLGVLGSAAGPALEEALGHSSVEVRYGAAAVLYQWHDNAPASAGPALRKMLAESNGEARLQAAETLSRMTKVGEPRAETLAVLGEFVAHADSTQSVRAGRALRRLGTKAKSVRPRLVEALDKQSDKAQVALTLLHVDPSSAKVAMPYLAPVFATAHHPLLWETFEQLDRLADNAKPAIASLTRLAKNEKAEGRIRARAVETMARIEPSAIRPFLGWMGDELAKEDYDDLVCESALTALLIAGSESKPAFAGVQKFFLREENLADLRCLAGLTLLAIDPERADEARTMVQALATGKKYKDAYLGEVTYHVENLGPHAKPLVGELLPLLRNPSAARKLEGVLSGLDPERVKESLESSGK